MRGRRSGWGALVLTALVLASCGAIAPQAVPSRALVQFPVVGAGVEPVAQQPDVARVQPIARSPQFVFPYTVQPEWAPTAVNHHIGRDGAAPGFLIPPHTPTRSPP